jgi:hypothetical protein
MHTTEQKKLHNKILSLEKTTQTLGAKMTTYRNTAFNKFPLLFLLLSSFGLVSTIYGFEKLIDTVPFLNEHPATLLITGLTTLIITGSLYKRLS